MTDDRTTLTEVAREWLAARDVIAAFFRDMNYTKAASDHNAACILARLAHHTPPILVTMEGPKCPT